jgi:hypothetical protein
MTQDSTVKRYGITPNTGAGIAGLQADFIAGKKIINR